MEKCFCAKTTLCPTINETDESVVSDTDKVCVLIFMCLLFIYFNCNNLLSRVRISHQVSE